MLYRPEDGLAVFAPMDGERYRPYEIRAIVDRVGTGDAFAGALIFALQTPELSEPARALRFAVAASCLSHSIQGDFLFCTRAEVEALMEGNASGHLSR
jgi:2-dehydro-3-deoxygluconokinase